MTSSEAGTRRKRRSHGCEEGEAAGPWKRICGAPPLPEVGEVHVVRASALRGERETAELRDLLRPDELEAVDRQRMPSDRARRTAARGILRLLLSGYLGCAPEVVEIRTGHRGKPFVKSRTRSGVLNFNLSHAGGLLLFAFSTTGAVGVDVERVRSLPDLEPLARRFFSPMEAEVLRRLPPGLRSEGFFRCWTRKEAVLKARGTGLSGGLSSFDVSLVPGAPAQILGWREPGRRMGDWSLRHLKPWKGYVGALAVRGGLDSTRFWTW